MPAIKSVADPHVQKKKHDTRIVTIVNETFAWSAQEGALLNQRMHVVLTGSSVDVVERRLDRFENVRFDPMKERATYNDYNAQMLRQYLLRYIVENSLFSSDFIGMFSIDSNKHGKDNAVLAKKSPEGGINLASKYLKMENAGERVDLKFDPAMVAEFRRGDFSGVTFRVLDVVPVNLMLLLGLNQRV